MLDLCSLSRRWHDFRYGSGDYFFSQTYTDILSIPIKLSSEELNLDSSLNLVGLEYGISIPRRTDVHQINHSTIEMTFFPGIVN